MSVKTFSDPEVRKVLDEHFVFVELNVENEKEAAGWFASAAIPDT
jgi:thioredoxin-related protein